MFNFLHQLVARLTNLIINLGMVTTVFILPVLLYHLVHGILLERFTISLIIGLVTIIVIKINKELQGGK